MKLKTKLATAGDLDSIRALIAEFYYCSPESVRLEPCDTHWRVVLARTSVSTVVVKQGRYYRFGAA